jgi:SM-20-related protein
VKLFDNVLLEDTRKTLYDFLEGAGWEHGWKSRSLVDEFSFWHKHFAGHRKTNGPDKQEPYDCAKELSEKAPLLFDFWTGLRANGHTLIRCYANAFTYGMDGTIHTDSTKPDNFTIIYYPHKTWEPNWGGETVFFNKEKTDIIGCVYPKPNRLIMFPGDVPHVGRGVSRTCPVMRITLMFKTYLAQPNYTIPAKYESFLTEIGAKEVTHSGRTLWDHLKGTYDILCKWGEPEHVCIAGLFHSIYGTEYFKHACVPIEERPKIIALIGASAERLVYRFCTIPRKEFNERELKAIADANRLEQKFQKETI